MWFAMTLAQLPTLMAAVAPSPFASLQSAERPKVETGLLGYEVEGQIT
jgi:hypothetical protein